MADSGRSTYIMDSWPYNPKVQRLAKFLGFFPERDGKGLGVDRRLGEKIREIYDWGRKRTQSEDELDVFDAVTQLKRDLGYSETGQTLINRIWQYIQLDSKVMEIDRQKERVEKEKSLLSDKQETHTPEENVSEDSLTQEV